MTVAGQAIMCKHTANVTPENALPKNAGGMLFPAVQAGLFPSGRMGRVGLFLVLGCFCLCLAGCHGARAWPVHALPEREAPLRDFAHWRAIVAAEQASSSFGAAGLSLWPPKSAAQWRHLKARLEREDTLGKARLVNAFFNQQPYVADKRAWNLEEHWARPVDFMLRGGDCEDYAIAKYYALKDAGVSAGSLRIAGVWNLKKGEGHALLVLYAGGVQYALDNEQREVKPLAELPWYKVYYFLNESLQWTLAP